MFHQSDQSRRVNLLKDRDGNKIIRVLYIGMKNDYGDPHRGLCHEYVNFLTTLEKMGNVHVDSFFYDEVLSRKGMKVMNEHLITAVKEQSPDICFFVLFTDEITKETVRWVTEKSGAKTFNWFTDDHWRFDLHSKFYAITAITIINPTLTFRLLLQLYSIKNQLIVIITCTITANWLTAVKNLLNVVNWQAYHKVEL